MLSVASNLPLQLAPATDKLSLVSQLHAGSFCPQRKNSENLEIYTTKNPGIFLEYQMSPGCFLNSPDVSFQLQESTFFLQNLSALTCIKYMLHVVHMYIINKLKSTPKPVSIFLLINNSIKIVWHTINVYKLQHIFSCQNT